MSENTGTSKEAELQGELRRKLVKRLAVAGGLVAVLLGVLAFFDYLATPEEPEEVTTYSKPVPVAPKKELTQPVTPAANLPEAPPPAQQPAPAAPVEAPTQAPATPATHETPAKPAVAAQPSPPAPEVAPAPRVTPARPTATPQARPPAAVPEGTGAPTPSVPDEAAVAKQPAKVIEVAPRPVPSPARLLSGYVLQAGVFTSAQRAEELHAKLTLNGIPSTMEARVQVGPFKTRAEAETAREKLKALGIDSVMIPPAGGKH